MNSISFVETCSSHALAAAAEMVTEGELVVHCHAPIGMARRNDPRFRPGVELNAPGATK